MAGPVGGVPAVRPRFPPQRIDDLSYGLPMGRIDYLGKSVADLGVSIPRHPPIRCGFTYGVRFPGKRTGGRGMPFGGNEAEIVNVDKDDDADILVLMPGEFDEPEEALVVIVKLAVSSEGQVDPETASPHLIHPRQPECSRVRARRSSGPRASGADTPATS